MADRQLPVLLLSTDLLWTSRISGLVRAAEMRFRSVGNEEKLCQLAAQEQPALILIDLDALGKPVAALIGKLHESCNVPPRVMAFGAHMEVGKLKAAREAGCEPVWPRSQVEEHLPGLLQSLKDQAISGG
jgi:CheY-like chemotaxis protein